MDWQNRSTYVEKEKFDFCFYDHVTAPADKQAERYFANQIFYIVEYILFRNHVKHQAKGQIGSDLIIFALQQKDKFDPSRGTPFFFFMEILQNRYIQLNVRFWTKRLNRPELYLSYSIDEYEFNSEQPFDEILDSQVEYLLNPDRLRSIACVNLFYELLHTFERADIFDQRAARPELAIAFDCFAETGGSYKECRFIVDWSIGDESLRTAATFWLTAKELPGLTASEDNLRLGVLWKLLTEAPKMMPESEDFEIKNKNQRKLFKNLLIDGYLKDTTAKKSYRLFEKFLNRRGLEGIWFQLKGQRCFATDFRKGTEQ
jgi:hypothetical protein